MPLKVFHILLLAQVSVPCLLQFCKLFTNLLDLLQWDIFPLKFSLLQSTK